MQKLTHWSCMEGTPACIPHRTDPGRLFFRKIFFQMFIVWNIFSSPKNQATLYFLKYQSLEKVTCGHGMSHLLPVKPLSQMHSPGRTNGIGQWKAVKSIIVINILFPLYRCLGDTCHIRNHRFLGILGPNLTLSIAKNSLLLASPGWTIPQKAIIIVMTKITNILTITKGQRHPHCLPDCTGTSLSLDRTRVSWSMSRSTGKRNRSQIWTFGKME